MTCVVDIENQSFMFILSKYSRLNHLYNKCD